MLALLRTYPQPAAAASASGPPPDHYREVIVLGACGATELLPQNPDLPADVFTACLTTPIKVRCGGGQGAVGVKRKTRNASRRWK